MIDAIRSFFKDRFTWIIIILSFGLFANTLSHQLVWDDQAFIINQDHKLASLTQIFSGQYPVPDTRVYRPVRNALYAITLPLFKANPLPHHFVVILLHTVASLLVYKLLRLLFKSSELARIGALLFVLHPIHTESVNWVTAGYDIIFVIFYLLTLITHIQFRRNKINQNIPLVFSLLALFSNEMSLTLPFTIMAMDYYFWGIKIWDKKHVKVYATYIIVALIYWFTRSLVTNDEPHPVIVYEDIKMRIVLGVFLFGSYISQMLIPKDLTVDHNFQPGLNGLYSHDHNLIQPPPQLDFSSPNILIPLSFGVIWIAAILFSGFKKSRLTFPLIWVLLSLIAVLRIVPLPAIYVERYAYLASIGFIVVVLHIFKEQIKKFSTDKAAVGIFIVILIVLASQSYTRSLDWKTNFGLWTKTLQQNPESASATSALGVEYFIRGDLEKTLNYHRRASQMNPYVASFQRNYISILNKFEAYDEVIDFVHLLLKTDPTNLDLHTILASSYDLAGDYTNAMKYYQKAYDLIPPSHPAKLEIESLVDELDQKYDVVDLE